MHKRTITILLVLGVGAAVFAAWTRGSYTGTTSGGDTVTFDIGGADSAGTRPISIGAGTIGGSMVTSADPAVDGEIKDENGDPWPPHTIADFLNCATREWLVRTADGNAHIVFFSACTSELGAPSGDTIGSTQPNSSTGSPSALVD